MIYTEEHSATIHAMLANRYGNADATSAAVIYDVRGEVCAYAKRFIDGSVDVVNVNRALCMTSSRHIVRTPSMHAALVAEFGNGFRYVAA